MNRSEKLQVISAFATAMVSALLIYTAYEIKQIKTTLQNDMSIDNNYRTNNNKELEQIKEQLKELKISMTFMELEGEMGVMCETVANGAYFLQRDEHHSILCNIKGKVFNYDELMLIYNEISND